MALCIYEYKYMNLTAFFISFFQSLVGLMTLTNFMGIQIRNEKDGGPHSNDTTFQKALG